MAKNRQRLKQLHLLFDLCSVCSINKPISPPSFAYWRFINRISCGWKFSWVNQARCSTTVQALCKSLCILSFNLCLHISRNCCKYLQFSWSYTGIGGWFRTFAQYCKCTQPHCLTILIFKQTYFLTQSTTFTQRRLWNDSLKLTMISQPDDRVCVNVQLLNTDFLLLCLHNRL